MRNHERRHSILRPVSRIGAAVIVAGGIIIGLDHFHMIEFHNPFSSTPATGSASIDKATYKPYLHFLSCPGYIDVLSGVDVGSSDKVLGQTISWAGNSSVDKLYPTEFPMCAPGGMPTEATVKSEDGSVLSVTVALPRYEPGPSRIDDLDPVICDNLTEGMTISQINQNIYAGFHNNQQSCEGIITTGGIIGVSATDAGNVIELSRELSDADSDLAVIPTAIETDIVNDAKIANRGPLEREYHTKNIKYAKSSVASGFSQIMYGLVTFGPEMKDTFNQIKFEQDGNQTKAVLKKANGQQGTIYIDTKLTKSDVKNLNNKEQHIKAEPLSHFLYKTNVK